MRLVRWVVPSVSWRDAAFGFLLGSFITVDVFERSPEMDWGWPAVFTMVIIGTGFAFGALALMAGLDPWGHRIADYYYEFGRNGVLIVRAVRNLTSGELVRKERAVRAAHAWSRYGLRGGVRLDLRRDRVFELLGQSPMDGSAVDEICENVRASMLDAVVGKIDPHRYQEPRRIWREREHLEFLNVRATLLVTVIGLVALIGRWPV